MEGSSQKKDHLVRWEVVAQPIEQGGLGLGRVKERWRCLANGFGDSQWNKVVYGIPLFVAGMGLMLTDGTATNILVDPNPCAGIRLIK